VCAGRPLACAGPPSPGSSISSQASLARPSARATAQYAWAATPVVLPGGRETWSAMAGGRLLEVRNVAHAALAQAYPPPLIVVLCGDGWLRVDLCHLGLGPGHRDHPVGLGIGSELRLVAVRLGEDASFVCLGVGRLPDI